MPIGTRARGAAPARSRRGARWGDLAWAALLLLTAAWPAGADEPRLRARLDRTQVAVGGQVTLTVTLEGFSGRAGNPQIPLLPDIQVYDAGRSTNVSLINGRLSSSTSYSYILSPGRAGTFTIGPITLEDRGTSHASEALTLVVVPTGNAPPAGSSARGPDAREEAAAQGQGVFARLEADRREAYLDEQITLRFRLYQRADVALVNLADFQPPATEGFWREDLGPQEEYSVEIDGRTYRVREIRWALFATRAGELEVGPASVVAYLAGRSRGRGLFDDFFGPGALDQRPVPLRTETLRVRVRPLPEEGRPEGFSGSVGDYRLETRVDVPQARRGEPFTLSARVSGTGHVQTIGAPIWPDWGGLRVYDSGEAVSVEKGRDRVGGEKSFTQVLIAQRAGRVRLDPVRFVYFDPARGRYVRTEGAPLEIEVIEGGALAPGADDGSAVGQDILYIRTGIEGELRRQAATGSPVAWVVLGLPLALVAGGGWWRRRTAAGGRAVLGRRSQAHRRARRALAALPPDGDGPRVASGVAEALETYLTAWLDVSVRGTTRRELRAALLERGLAEDLAQRATGALDRSEEIRFGAGGGADAGAGLRRDAETLLGELEAALRRAPRGPSS